MEFKFNALSQDPDTASEAVEERKMFAMDMASEGRELGASAVTEVAGDTPPSVAVSEPLEGAPAAAVSEPEAGTAAQTVATEGDASQGGETVENAGSTAPEGQEGATPGDDDPEKEKEAGALDSLMRLAAGKVSEDEVKIDVAPSAVSSSPFQALSASRQLDPEAERALDDLVSTLTETPVQAPAAGTGQETSRAGVAPGASVPGQPAPVQQQMVATGAPMSASGQLGELAGRAIAGAVATPFIALTSAARHLRSHFQSGVVPPAPASAASSLQASKGVPLPMANTLETITDWKCERIEKAGEAVEKAAAAIMGTEDFITWEDDVRKVAGERGVAPFDVVREMHTNAELAPLKEKMDRLWDGHSDKVAAYRTACDDFERNVRNVVKEFPNSEDSIKSRVANAMKRVEEETEFLPGFGDKMGEYTKALAERVRELAKMIAEFVTELMRRLGGKTRTSDLSMP